MVSYYNPLSPAMFPNPPQMGGVARHQPTSASAAAAAAAAAGHAYFHNAHAQYAAAAYGHPGVFSKDLVHFKFSFSKIHYSCQYYMY